MTGRHPRRLRDVFARYGYAVPALDQMALSAFAFVLNLCLVRALSATEYGIVSLWMAVALIAIGAQNALVNTPLSVYVPAIADPANASRLEGAIGTVNLLAMIGAIVAIAALNLGVPAPWEPHSVAERMAVPGFIAAGMYREFYRSVAFSRRDMAMLLWTDGPYLAVTGIGLAAMLVRPQYFASLAGAFLAMSAGCVISRLCLRLRFGAAGLRPFTRGWVEAYRRIAGEVAWSLLGVGATHLHTRSYVYVIANLAGLAQLGAINVIGVLFRPVRTMLTPWGRSALPRMAAQIADGDRAGFDRAVWQAFAIAAIASAAWFAVLRLGWRAIEHYFLVGKYPGAWALMLPWALAAALNAMEYTLAIPLRAAREFKFLAHTTLLSAPITVAATAALVHWRGYTWAMYGVALGNLFMLLMFAGRLYAVRSRLAAAAVPEVKEARLSDR